MVHEQTLNLVNFDYLLIKIVHRKKPEDFKVVVNGQIELPIIGNNTSEERNVVEIVHHEDYNTASLYNDVALLILDKPYVLGENFINKICLPPKDINMEGMRCLVAGWGKENIENGEYFAPYKIFFYKQIKN